ncbi:MAG: hypothetical protein K6B14_08245 [Lachnospiraceae bacterium]|nr:hypothetical protein [Lachnospiraceae bacterium]
MMLTAIIEGLIWSVLWIIYVYIIVKRFPWEMLHDYPEDIQKASTLPEPSIDQMNNAKLFSAVGSILIFGSLIAFGLMKFRSETVPFITILLFIFAIAMIWNVVDLLVMDWIIICRITPKWVVIKGTEGCEGYHDYMYHFKGFLIGCIYTTVLSIVISGIVYALLKFLIWR